MFAKGLFWFRRDLRLYDNAALHNALTHCSQIACVFVFDENILGKLADKDDRRITFIWKSILEIQEKLQKLGSDLFIFYGDPIDLIPKLSSSISAEAVFTNRDYETQALTRDEMVQAKLNEKKIQFFTSKDQIIFEASEVTKPDGKPYTVFTPFKKTWYKTLDNHEYDFLASYPIERHLKSTGVASRLIQKEEIESIRLKLSKPGRNEPVLQVRSLSDMGFVEAKDLIVGAGSAAADEQLDSFIKTHLLSYKDQRDFPDLRATSNLSTHLRFGTLSIRKCFRAALNIVRAQTEPKAKENAETWLSELIWREFYSMILQAYPHVQEKAFKPEYQNLMWRVDEKLFQAWADGMTGYPIVDAGMRQLKQTGLMHNRVRMITASFLTKDLLIDWRKGEAHFARYLLDFDLASNNGGWQWASSTGTDAVPYFRIFNPSLQSGKFDPEAKYIKEFVPELKNIEPAKIHKLEFSVANYPKPIIRHDEAKNAVMSLFKRTTAMKDKES